MGKELALLPLVLAVLVPLAAGDCIVDKNNATVPVCSDWIGPNNEPYFFPHQYNCSQYWECNVYISPTYDACLRECGKGFNHTVLYYDEYVKPGPTCNYPEATNCTNKSPECAACEAWQTCSILDDGTVSCSPDCKLDVHCDGPGCPVCINQQCVDPDCCTDADCPDGYSCEEGKCIGCLTDDDCASNEYCDGGTCRLGCRTDKDCDVMTCSTCDNHVCNDPECCTDPDCASNEFCNAAQICEEGCNENSDCTGTSCSSCDMSSNTCVDPECCGDADCTGMTCSTCDNNVCHDPECCVDPDCASNEFCNAAQICEEGCNENSDCTSTSCSSCDMSSNTCVDPECCGDADCTGMTCSTCDNNVCHDPECCVDPDCASNEFCNAAQICEEGCNENSDCTDTTCSTCDMSNNSCVDPECCGDADCTSMVCSTCESNSCVDPECCTDDDCKGAWICENGVCGPECLKDDDCEANEYCDTVAGICEIGCRDDSGCTAMSCSTCVDHVCNDPECCLDDDCKTLDEPVCMDQECIPGCRSDEMCPGVDLVCDNTYSNCQWCNQTDGTNDNIGYCDNGCATALNCAGTQACANHVCISASYNSLQKISFKTDKCEGCGSSNAEPWLTMKLTGADDKNGPTQCSTGVLDHTNKVDFNSGVQSVFEGENDKTPFGACYLANLQGEVQKLDVTWSGDGSWTPENGEITFSMSDPSSFEYVCKLNKNELSPSQPTAQGDCGTRYKIRN